MPRLLSEGFATGGVSEVLLIPGKPKLPFDKVLFFGLGVRSYFNETVILENAEGLRCRAFDLPDHRG